MLYVRLKLSVLLLLLTLIHSCSFAQKENRIDAKLFAQGITDTAAQLVDVRTPEEYQDGYIPGALNIDWYSEGFELDAEKLDKNKPVYVYCRSGKRSAAAADKLQKMGFAKVYDLDGGYEAWKGTKHKK